MPEEFAKKMKPRASILSRLTITLALAMTAVFVLAGSAILLFLRCELVSHQARDLGSRASMVATLIQHADDSYRFSRVQDKVISSAEDEAGIRFQIRGPAPYAVGRDWPADAVHEGGSDGYYWVQVGHQKFMVKDIVLAARGERPEVVLTTAVDMTPLEATWMTLAFGVLVVTVAGVFAAALLAWTVVKRELKPLKKLSEHASALDPADHSLRLPQDRLPLELDGLASAFNGALHRLEESYVRLAAFNADVAHELRTPLANIIGQTQVALSRRRNSADFEDVLQSNLEDLERLRGIINDMLFLARADQGAIAENLETRSLAEIVRKTSEFMGPVLEDVGLVLKIDGDANVRIEPSLLGRAITNLIDNAVRHGIKPGIVGVTIDVVNDQARLTIRNRGAPIPAHHLDRLFDRFYRPDPARFRSDESHGLGLAIVKAVVVMHRGRVFARCEGGEIFAGFTLQGTSLGNA